MWDRKFIEVEVKIEVEVEELLGYGVNKVKFDMVVNYKKG